MVFAPIQRVWPILTSLTLSRIDHLSASNERIVACSGSEEEEVILATLLDNTGERFNARSAVDSLICRGCIVVGAC